MSRSLLPLNALRAFEVSARYLSFTKAAEELNVTSAAVGHHVKALEDVLGVQLFRRLNRALRLTDAGQACLPLLTQGFDQIEDAVQEAKSHNKLGILVLSVAPTFAVKWLIPRLFNFQSIHPDITIRVETTMAVSDLVRDGIDIGIRFCAKIQPGQKGEKLLDEQVVPVCAPSLLKGPKPILTPDNLRHQTLIHVEGETTDPDWATWEDWLRTANVTGVDPHLGPKFTQTIAAAQAAIDGHGVALIGQACVLDDLAAGRLVRPFDIAIPTVYSYYVVTPPSLFEQPNIVAFRHWLREEARKSMSEIEA